MKQWLVEMLGNKYYYTEPRIRYIIVTAADSEKALIHAGAKLWNVYREYCVKTLSVTEYTF